MVSYQKSIVKYGMGIFDNATKSREKFRCFDENRVRPFLLHGTTENGFRYRVAAPSIRFVPWAALASCWPLPQQLLPVSAAWAFIAAQTQIFPILFFPVETPLSHLALLDASSPKGGAFWHLSVSANEAPPFGGAGTP